MGLQDASDPVWPIREELVRPDPVTAEFLNKRLIFIGVPYRIRTGVAAVRGRFPLRNGMLSPPHPDGCRPEMAVPPPSRTLGAPRAG